MAEFKDKIKKRYRDGFWSQGPAPEIKNKPIHTGYKSLSPADQLKQVRDLVNTGLISQDNSKRLIEILYPGEARLYPGSLSISLQDVEDIARSFRLSNEPGHLVYCKAEYKGIMSRIHVVGEVGLGSFASSLDQLRDELTAYLVDKIPVGLEISVSLFFRI